MADTLDVLTLAEAQTAINSDDAAHDDELAQMVTTISRRLDEMCGPVVQRSVTEYHDGGCNVLWPRVSPVASVTTLTEYDGTAETVLTAETFGTQPSDAYVLVVDASFAHGHHIARRSGGGAAWFPHGLRNVELVYVAGRATDTASVDARFKGAAAAVVRRLWKRESGSWAQSSDFFVGADAGTSSGFFRAIDPMVRELLADELKLPGIA